MARAYKRSTRSEAMRSSSIARNRVDRLRWLMAHPERLVGVPSDAQDVDDIGRAKLLALGEELVRLGLYSTRTLRSDRNSGIRALVGEARRRLA